MLFIKQVHHFATSVKNQATIIVKVLTDPDASYVANLSTNLLIAQNTLPGS
jgi:hypothetical protein